MQAMRPSNQGAPVLESAISRFTAFADLSAKDLGDLLTLAGGRRTLQKGDHVSHEGHASAGLYLLLEGWTASSITFADGSRQLIKVHLPGDMLGLPSLALRHCAESIVALTPIAIGVIPEAALGRLFELNPRLAALLFLISQEERVMLMDRLASLGATSAVRRLAALLLQIHARVLRSDPTATGAFDFPLSQRDVADLNGVSAVHLSRALRQLRAAKLLTWTRYRITMIDVPGLTALAGIAQRELNQNARWLPMPGK